ncbi:methyltransferase domain-containing protein [Alteromonas sediminis]|uniref:Methyltransferase domain-containing protein n=1 Tax=Alteromonas sediminis TaxID=2259342 RepID=A0A3N5ZE78_9ALTE|nr:methyltransferase domain-containing protein [Alteromonas sediminis]RPJ68618.1 methyltransferase domain-containing protein [Alteromonas sediminis]
MALKHKNDIAERFSKAANRYDDIAAIQVTLANKALAHRQHCEGVVLDIGCATGQHTVRLGANVYGLDLAMGMLQKAKHSFGSRAAWLNADMDALPFQPHSFDQVFSSMALQWSDSPVQVMREIHRVLKPTGNATLLIPVKGSFHQLYSAYKTLGLAPKLNSQLSEADWLNAIKYSGFTLKNTDIVVETDTFTNLVALLSSISKIGAASSDKADRAPLTRKTLDALSAAYPLNKGGYFLLDYRCLLVTLEK